MRKANEQLETMLKLAKAFGGQQDGAESPLEVWEMLASFDAGQLRDWVRGGAYLDQEGP